MATIRKIEDIEGNTYFVNIDKIEIIHEHPEEGKWLVWVVNQEIIIEERALRKLLVESGYYGKAL